MRSSRSLFAMLAAVVLAAPLVAAPPSNADKTGEIPTFYGDVLPVLQENCQVCHRAGGANLGGMVAPMSFTTYEDTRPWAKSMAKQVEARAMPPWHASPDQAGAFHNERTLAEEEIATIVAWARAGAPAGDVSSAPESIEWPTYEGGYAIGNPDLEIRMGPKYFVEDNVEDQYITFVTPITEEMLPEPRWVKAVEFLPGSPVVHHIVAPPLGGIAPGNQPSIYPEGYGTMLKPGDTVRWSMHYHKEAGEGTGVWDQSKVGIRFYPEGYTPDRPVVVDPMAKMDFVIPAGDPAVSYNTRVKFERDSYLMSILPHMHLRGKAAKYIAHYPDGTTETLLEVPKYDFNWQTSYEYAADDMKKLPAGTEVEFIATWDNSADNPFNPDPTEEVRFGEPTTAEMMFGFLTYADAEAGYTPEGSGWLNNNRKSREMTGERMRKILKERMGLDYDTLPEDKQKEVLERFGMTAEQAAIGASAGH